MTSIYVGNLSYDSTEEDIRQAFAQYGEVANVNVIIDRETGRPRGFAFVEMPNGTEAKEAIQDLNETEIAGRAVARLRIPLAPPVESLNVGVAAGLVLFEAARQRGFAGRAP